MMFSILVGLAHGNYTLLEKKVSQFENFVGIVLQQNSDEPQDNSLFSRILEQANKLLGTLSVLSSFILSFQFVTDLIETMINMVAVDFISPFFPSSIQAAIHDLVVLMYCIIYAFSIFELMTGKSIL